MRADDTINFYILLSLLLKVKKGVSKYYWETIRTLSIALKVILSSSNHAVKFLQLTDLGLKFVKT